MFVVVNVIFFFLSLYLSFVLKLLVPHFFSFVDCFFSPLLISFFPFSLWPLFPIFVFPFSFLALLSAFSHFFQFIFFSIFLLFLLLFSFSHFLFYTFSYFQPFPNFSQSLFFPIFSFSFFIFFPFFPPAGVGIASHWNRYIYIRKDQTDTHPSRFLFHVIP